MVEDLARWTLLGADEEGLGADEEGLGADEEGLGADEEGGTLECTRAGGLLRATSRITIRVDGPEGIPSAVLSVGSRSEGRGLSRDRANVVELVRPFERRVC